MKNANFLLLEDNVPVYKKADITSAEVTKLNSGDEIIRDEKFKKHGIHWCTVVLPDNRKGYMLADAKGFKIALMVLTQASADAYEAPDASSKVVLTYHKDDEIHLIGSVKQNDVLWVKTESPAGVVGFIPASVKADQVAQLTPSQKWPVRVGGTIGVVAAVLAFFLSISDSHHAGTTIGVDCTVGFFVGFIAGYLPAMLFMKIRRSIVK